MKNTDVGMKFEDVRKRLKRINKVKAKSPQLKANVMNGLIRQAGYKESGSTKPDEGVSRELCNELASLQPSRVKMYSPHAEARYGRGCGNSKGGIGRGYTFHCPACEMKATEIYRKGQEWYHKKCDTKCVSKRRF